MLCDLCKKELNPGAKKYHRKCYWKTLKGRKLSEITKRRMSMSRTGENNYGWKGGRIKTSHGYIRIKVDGHPNSDCNGYVYEHRYIIEQKIGRYLKKNETVHHINEVKNDNRPENLLGPLSMKEHIMTRKTFANQYGVFANKRHQNG